MDKRVVLEIISVFAVVGVLFSGYLTYYTFASGRPGCEVFILGMPSCFYGTIMYLVVFALSVSLAVKQAARNWKTLALSAISFVGILFAAYLTFATLSAVSCTNFDIFGVPPCVYGLVMYLALLSLAALELKVNR